MNSPDDNDTGTEAPLLRYFLQVECVATAGNTGSCFDQGKQQEIEKLPLPQKQSERTKMDFNSLLSGNHVLGRCSFGMTIDNRGFNFQSMTNGPYVVDLLARLSDNGKAANANGDDGVEVEIVLSSTFQAIGGLRKFASPHSPMILGNWYFLGGGGGAQVYLSHVARLTEIDNAPTESEILARTDARQASARNIMDNRADLLE